MFNQTIPRPDPELQTKVNLIPRVLRGEIERGGGGGRASGKGPMEGGLPDSTDAVNRFDLLFLSW